MAALIAAGMLLYYVYYALTMPSGGDQSGGVIAFLLALFFYGAACLALLGFGLLFKLVDLLVAGRSAPGSSAKRGGETVGSDAL